ncbi:MAG: hypothetical protein H7233_15000 [Pseudorhodobacter sp.]|nr:hypothetical protein [Frankiaceae bacterium]
MRGLPAGPPALQPPAPPLAAPSLPAPLPPAPLPSAPRLPVVPDEPPSRVALGFRDGTVQQLTAGSEQSVALEQLAAALARRD